MALFLHRPSSSSICVNVQNSGYMFTIPVIDSCWLFYYCRTGYACTLMHLYRGVVHVLAAAQCVHAWKCTVCFFAYCSECLVTRARTHVSNFIKQRAHVSVICFYCTNSLKSERNLNSLIRLHTLLELCVCCCSFLSREGGDVTVTC